jgi:hypothetical protein
MPIFSRGAGDPLAARADRCGEGCGDKEHALEAVIGVGNATEVPGRWF